MSKEKQIETIKRSSFQSLGISKERYLQLKAGCRAGVYSPEILEAACKEFEFVELRFWSWGGLVVVTFHRFSHIE